MFFKGGTSAPMAQAYILGFMQSYERSFKMGDVREVIGTIDQDRLFAIGGKLGSGPARVPITVQVGGPGCSRPRTYHFSCWKNRDFLPTMSAAAAQEAYSASVAEGGELTARIHYRFTLADGRVIEKNLFESDRGDIISQPVSALLFDMFMLEENPFLQADIRAIDMNVEVSPGVHQDMLVSAQLEHPSYRPGDRVSVIGRFRPWRGEGVRTRLRPGPSPRAGAGQLRRPPGRLPGGAAHRALQPPLLFRPARFRRRGRPDPPKPASPMMNCASTSSNRRPTSASMAMPWTACRPR